MSVIVKWCVDQILFTGSECMKDKGVYEEDVLGTGVRRIKDDTLMQNLVVILSRCGAYNTEN